MKKIIAAAVAAATLCAMPCAGFAQSKLIHFDTVVIMSEEEISREAVLQNVVISAEREKEQGKNLNLTAKAAQSGAAETSGETAVKKIKLMDVIK